MCINSLSEEWPEDICTDWEHLAAVLSQQNCQRVNSCVYCMSRVTAVCTLSAGGRRVTLALHTFHHPSALHQSVPHTKHNTFHQSVPHTKHNTFRQSVPDTKHTWSSPTNPFCSPVHLLTTFRQALVSTTEWANVTLLYRVSCRWWWSVYSLLHCSWQMSLKMVEPSKVQHATKLVT